MGVSLDYILLGIEPVKLEDKTGKESAEREEPTGIKTIDDVIRLMNHSPLFNFNVMGFAARFYMEHEAYIKKEIIKKETVAPAERRRA